MRVQFSVSDSEWQTLLKKAELENYPDVHSYCKDLALGCRTYANLWKTVVDKISKKKSGETFVLRELVDTPPANLGVKLYEHQQDLGIKVIKKDNLNTNVFEKL